MHVDHPESDQRWDTAVRSETEEERLDRNWNSLLQELRVTQTGVQLLTGFLLTLPFQNRFTSLGSGLRVTYLTTVACSLAATVLLVAPVAMHRMLFRRHRLKTVVSVSHRCAYAGLLLLGAALTGVAVVVFGSVLGDTAALIAAVLTAAAMAAAWVVFPLLSRGRSRGFGDHEAREHRRNVDPESGPADARRGIHQSGSRRAAAPDERRRRGPADAGGFT